MNKRCKIYNKKDCLTFISLIKEYTIVKYKQIVAFETFLSTNSSDIKNEMHNICNKEKHESEYFTQLNVSNENKDGFFEKLKLKQLKSNLCNEILLYFSKL